jgi:putative Mn2+ efflux pump MntP
MPPGVGLAAVRVATVVPVVLIVLFTGLLWLLGLMCGPQRRLYVTHISQQAIGAIGVLLHGPVTAPALRPRHPRGPTRDSSA